MALLAFQTLDHRGFLTADVGACAAVQEHIEIVTRLARVFPDQTSIVRFVDRSLQGFRFADIFAADVKVCRPCPHGITSD